MCLHETSGPGKEVIAKGVFPLEEFFLGSLEYLASLENGRIVLCFPQSGCSLESLLSLDDSLESLEMDFLKTNCKRPL